VTASKNQSNYRQIITDHHWGTRKISPGAAWYLALLPVSPVQLVTRALRNVWSAYHASAWHADRYRYKAATFETYHAAASATGTEYAGSAGTGLPYL
jgi:hypothetical protein